MFEGMDVKKSKKEDYRFTAKRLSI